MILSHNIDCVSMHVVCVCVCVCILCVYVCRYYMYMTLCACMLYLCVCDIVCIHDFYYETVCLHMIVRMFYVLCGNVSIYDLVYAYYVYAIVSYYHVCMLCVCARA